MTDHQTLARVNTAIVKLDAHIRELCTVIEHLSIREQTDERNYPLRIVLDSDGAGIHTKLSTTGVTSTEKLLTAILSHLELERKMLVDYNKELAVEEAND